MKIIRPLATLRRVYCAGPLFNAAERREMELIGATLRAAGFDTFVPHADSLEFVQVLPYLLEQGYDAAFAGQCIHQAIFALDTYQVLVGCGSLVFNMNGRTPDEGGVAEMTMAWMTGKPIVIYKEDARSAIAGRDNPLVVGQGGFATVDEIERLGEALKQRVQQCSHDQDWEIACPPHVEAALRTGEVFWNQLQTLGAARPPAVLAECMLELHDGAGELSAAQSHRQRHRAPA